VLSVVSIHPPQKSAQVNLDHHWTNTLENRLGSNKIQQIVMIIIGDIALHILTVCPLDGYPCVAEKVAAWSRHEPLKQLKSGQEKPVSVRSSCQLAVVFFIGFHGIQP
jgi:hypothetical protein